MRYTVEGFNQKRLVELGLDSTDAVILRWFVDFCNSGKMAIISYQGKNYYWVSYQAVIDDLPIIGITNRNNIARRFQKNVDCGLMEKYVKMNGGTYTGFRLVEDVYITLIQDIKEEGALLKDRALDYSKVDPKDYSINNTTSEEVENIKNKLLDDFNNIDSQLSKEMYYADYKETTGTVHSSVRNVIDSLDKKSLVSQFLKMDLYSSEGQKIAPLSLLGVLGDYLVSCFEDTDGFIRKNEKLPFNDIGIFIYNNRRLEDLISFYQQKNGFTAATA